MKTFRIIFSVFILLSFSLQGFTQDESSADDNVIKLYVGQVYILAVKNPTRIVIGNPSIADVTDVKKAEVTISPKRAGTTNLVLWDDVGEKSHKIIVMAEDVTDFKRRIDNLLEKLGLPEVHTQVADEESKVLLLGRVKNAQDRERIAIVLGSLIDKTTDLIEVRGEESIIEIDVQVLELNRDSTKLLGFTWPGTVTLTDKSGPTTSAVTGLKNVFHVSDFTRTAFNVTLDALVQEGKAKILSRPKLACQSGKEAELLVGGEKPIFTTQVISGGGTGTDIEYKEFGIKLKIKPTVNDDKKINLALNMEVSEVGEAEFIGLTSARTAQAYPLTKRNASTELTLNDGQTMAIGGLVKQKTEEDVRKTAFLGDIPILGLLFRQTERKTGGGQGERGDTELFIALTPTIVHSDSSAQIKETVSLKLPHEEADLETASNIPEHLANYIRVVQTKILDATYYPLEAQDAGWEGRVKVSLNINFNGDLKDVTLLESSGYNILDEAALEVARVQAPYPPFPPQIDSQEIWVDVPIVYKKN